MPFINVRCLNGKTFAEIGKIHGINFNSVKTIYLN